MPDVVAAESILELLQARAETFAAVLAGLPALAPGPLRDALVAHAAEHARLVARARPEHTTLAAARVLFRDAVTLRDELAAQALWARAHAEIHFAARRSR